MNETDERIEQIKERITNVIQQQASDKLKFGPQYWRDDQEDIPYNEFNKHALEDVHWLLNKYIEVAAMLKSVYERRDELRMEVWEWKRISWWNYFKYRLKKFIDYKRG